MKIAIAGIGYVGTVSGACLADLGHEVILVDINENKVDALNAGHSPIVEAGLDALIGQGISTGKLRATINLTEAVSISEATIVCVGTPTGSNGDVQLGDV